MSYDDEDAVYGEESEGDDMELHSHIFDEDGEEDGEATSHMPCGGEDDGGETSEEDESDNSVTPEDFGLRGDKARNIYCDKAELYEEIRKYQKEGKPTDALGEMLIKIALHMSTMSRFWRYSHEIKEELVDNAVMQLLLSVPKFNLKDEKKNPFGYLSMICYRDMLHTLKKHFKQVNITKELSKAHISRLMMDNPGDERLAMLKSTLERNEEYNNFLKNDRYPYQPKQVDTFALSKKEQARRRRSAERKAAKTKKSAK